ncbi:low affinity iron permease family protein [Amycolatopsis acidiphila]|uniref:Low affinity iron permease family protein n=1 Tax=Amycolatopsis acidiphila TaxID=715473 RepID=A0A558AME0_9PSEU|nr:low affinity iron permease family protein [Amycolatopsis acidiphila]
MPAPAQRPARSPPPAAGNPSPGGECADGPALQLLLNSVTSVVTFVMVFIIQSEQNRGERATQAKLDAQNHVLMDVAQQVGARPPGGLPALTGLEEAPERHIRSEQRRVRERG